jgi:hypothetical protein
VKEHRPQVLLPGQKCVIATELTCEVNEVEKDAILVSVSVLQEKERGVPAATKLPYASRFFKNVGIARTETEALLRIPKDQIEAITTICSEAPAKLDHVQQAIEHLKAAGLNELAEAVQHHVKREADKELLARKRKEVQQLQRQIARLQAAIGKSGACRDDAAQPEPQQIQVDLAILEISLTKMREHGFDLGESGLGAQLQSESRCPGEQCAIGVLDRDAEFVRLIRKLQKAGIAKILAEPTLITLSGRPATFRSGGEFPVQVPQSGGQTAVELVEFGTRVDLMPLHLGDGKLRLEIRPVISEIDSSRSVNVDGCKVPGLRVRMVDTAAELKTGQILAVGGMIRQVPSADPTGDDGEQQLEEIELIVLATPTLLECARGARAVAGRPCSPH